MKPYYQDKWVTIYHGDCREILPQLDAKADLVLTDPPYNVGRAYLGANDRRDDYEQWCRKWFGLLPPTAIVISVGVANLPMWYRIQVPDWLFCWFKGNNMGSASKYTNIGLWEPFLMYGTKRIGVDGCYCPIIPQKGDVGRHDCPKPEKLIAFLVGQLSDASLILDPFLGSGTTCYCAKKLNRYSIGIEIEERYCEIAARRCCQEVMELS